MEEIMIHKYKLKEIQDVLRLKHNPEQWQKEEKEIYDMLNELEMRLKDKILEVLKG